MNKLSSIAIKNIIKRPARSIALLILSTVLSLSVFAGTIVSMSLRNGLSSLEDRLGADIMVVPYEAVTKNSFEDVVLQGNVGYFYMDSKYLDEISTYEGIGKISAQYYLASVKAGCCSMRVQIIGYDPATDFAITPWIRRSTGKEIGYLDIVVGNSLNAFVGEKLSFFGVECNIAAKLDKTGTTYDQAVFATRETLETLTEASLNKQLNDYASINAGNIVSCILIDVADGYVIEDVVNNINIHNKKIRAIRTTNMISGIASSLNGATRITTVLTAVIWVIALGIMMVAFFMMTGERKKEFAVMRVLGASRRKLARIVLMEGIGLTLAGSLIGVVIGIGVILPFSNLIEAQLDLPFLLPGAGVIAAVALISVVLGVSAGALSDALAAYRIGRADTGQILRSGE